MKKFKGKLKEYWSFIKKYIFLIIAIIMVVLIILFSGNGLLSVIIPIIASELIPRIYVLSPERFVAVNNNNADIKSNKEILMEDSAILFIYITYLSVLVGYFGVELIHKYKWLENLYIYEIANDWMFNLIFIPLLFLVSLGVLLFTLSFISKKYK